ncbi:hypothetical protein [Mycobacterium persicum]|uniref:hypothetical protein n=1 Tax=Mycobacterium persicum TaxID=1487726 RepID=UPI0013C2C914|nr:hypothetical protein [Mycobacterium persicum]
MIEDLIPLSHMHLEGFDPYTMSKLDSEIFLDDIGRHCITRERAASMFAERAAFQARLREDMARSSAESERDREAQRQRLAAIHEAQKDLVAQGLSAHEVMLLSSGEYERRAEKSPTADYLSGNTEIRPISER